MAATRFLSRPEGRLAYDDEGTGPLVVCLPGMGDTRAEYRFLAPRLLAAGYRVVTVDLRGHGESDATFRDHSRPTAGADLVALLEHLGDGRAHLIGCSYGASAVAWAAAEAPDRVASVTMIGPFVRDVATPALQRLLLRAALLRPWGARVWSGFMATLYRSRKPADLAAHRAALRRNLAEPGRLEALQAMAASDCRDIEPRLPAIAAPVLVVMGTADPDFPDPAGEAATIAERVGGEVELLDGAGHYPHAERPDEAAERIIGFLARTTAGA